MFNRLPHHPTAFDDDWEGQPSHGAFFGWGLGLLVPLGLALYGVVSIATGASVFSGRDAGMTLHGENATAAGIAWIAAAVFLHCHYFWGNIYDQAWPAVLGKIIFACAFIAGLGFILVRAGVLGIV